MSWPYRFHVVFTNFNSISITFFLFTFFFFIKQYLVINIPLRKLLKLCVWGIQPPPTNVNDCIKYSHYNVVTMGAIATQITSLTIVYSTVYSDAIQRKHQSSASLAFVRGVPVTGEFPVHRWIPRTGPVTRKMFPFDDVIIVQCVSLYMIASHTTLEAA